MQAVFVNLIDLRHCCAAFVDILSLRGKRRRILAAVFSGADGCLRRARPEVFLVVTELFDALLDQAQRIVLIVNGEPARVLVVELFEILAQDANAETVKRRNERQTRAFL